MAEEKLNPAPLVQRLLEKSKAGRLQWEPTADENTFITSIAGGGMFRIHLVSADDFDQWGRSVTEAVPRLDMLDEQGRIVWEVRHREVEERGLWDLWETARRIGNRVDERLAAAIEALERL